MSERTANGETRATQQSRLLGTGARRWRRVSLAVALMLVGAGTAGWAVTQADHREGVLVAAGDLSAGQVVSPDDVRVAEIAGSEEVAAVPSTHMDRVVGQTVATPMVEGMLLAETALVEPDTYPQPGHVVVGAVVEPSQYPSSLREGSPVSVITTAKEGQTEEHPSDAAVSARVQSLTASEGDGARVELLVAEADAREVSRATAANRVALVRTPAGEVP
ncbi:SAF domain-containing protein [Haloactinospora alba]|uniref:SAF domain-containing protein n=1 Tax=Haloactinospora alba TaxID=405555 RepID=A0A543NLH5_9ACTN|nr:SAF domain-containing protein [Haloactinospora alba]TQN32670.1 SAF domain-containing protein [Haloactinospora alba]